MQTTDPLLATKERARAAGRTREESELPFLLECMKSPRDHAGFTLPMVGAASLAQFGLDTLRTTARELALSENPERRIAYAYALGKTRDERAIYDLETMTADEDDEVILWVSLAMADLGATAVEVLARTLADQKTLARVVYFGDALNKIGSLASRQRLSEILASLKNGLGAKAKPLLADIQSRRDEQF